MFLAFPVVASSPTVASIVIVSVLIAIAGDRIKVLTTEFLPLDSVHGVLAFAVFTQPDKPVFSEPGRQGPILQISPRSAVSGSPEPVVAMKIVVAAADKKPVIRTPNCCIDPEVLQQQLVWMSFHDYRGRWASGECH